MRNSRILAFGSFSVLIKYNRPGPGMPRFRRNAWKLGWLLNYGRAMCAGNESMFCLVAWCAGCRLLGCVFPCWILACVSYSLIVSMGDGSWSNLFCIVEMSAKFWLIRLSRGDPEPQEWPSKVMADPS